MSQETQAWLNTRVLIGYTEQRGEAWHYAAAEQGDEPNHYPGPVPVQDVLRRLFNFEVLPRSIYVDAFTDDDHPVYVEVPGKRAWVASDTGDVLGVHSDQWQGHQYETWLLETVADIIDDDLNIGSAGLLRNRARAWVSIEVPETITTPEGVAFRPRLTAATAFDGSMASTFKRHNQIVVCDNTLAIALGEDAPELRIRHSSGSGVRIGEAREALAIVHTMADEFAAEVARLCAWSVSDDDFRRHLNLMVPMPLSDDFKATAGTRTLRKRDQVRELYYSDERAAQWMGTAFGVLQAHNTWDHHLSIVRGNGGGVGRFLRNQEDALTGERRRFDADVLAKLASVTA